MFKWGFRSNLKIHGADESKSAQLQLKDSKDTISLSKLIREKLPVIDTSKKLWLNPFLFNGTLQTLYYTSHDSSKKFLVYYGREIFQYNDGGICSLDWVIPKPESKEEFDKLYKETLPEDSPRLHPRSRFFTKEELSIKKQGSSEETSPILVILHGLGGGSHEPLIRNLVEKFKEDPKSNDWDILVINSRGCCRTKITTGKLFTSFATDDIKEVLVELKKRYPNRPIYTAGLSFGSILNANLLGSQDPEVKKLIKASALVGCAWDLHDSAYHIDASWTGSYLFNPSLVKFLNKIVKNNFKELNSADPKIFSKESLQESKSHTKTWQFDSLYTCRTAGYDNAFDYYRDASPVRRLRYIDVPTLAINSTDDPAVSCRIPWMEAENNSYVNILETDLGGHLGYVQYSGEFWCTQVIHDYLTEFEKLIQ